MQDKTKPSKRDLSKKDLDILFTKNDLGQVLQRMT